MIKKMIISSSLAVLLSACAVNPDDATAVDFANGAETQVNYDSVTVTGSTYKALPEGNATGLIHSKAYVAATLPDDKKAAATSTIVIDLRYFDNDFIYSQAEVDGQAVALKPVTLIMRECAESCKYVQNVSFPVSTQSLLAAADTGYPYTIMTQTGKKRLDFVVPPQYIEGLLLAASKGATGETPPMAAPRDASPVSMSQDLYAKASDTEKMQYSDWAFANRKSITTPLTGEGKILPMLAEWFEKASVAERAEIVTWVISQ